MAAILALLLPFARWEGNFTSVLGLVVALGIITDLVSGWSVGWTPLFLSLEVGALLVYARILSLGNRTKLASGLIFSLFYWYASGRFFI